MTRKKALHLAIEIIKKCNNDNTQEIVNKLEEILSENPFRGWTKESILDAILTYADEHNNNLPEKKDLTTANKLPSITVIKHKFGTSAISKLYQTYFPHLYKQKKRNSHYRLYDYDKEYFLKIFKDNYERIKKEKKVKHVGMRLYDQNRMQGTPVVSTIMYQCDCSSYNELLIMCKYKIDIKKLKSSIHVTFID